MIRRVVCMVLGHNWSRQRYPAAQGDEQPVGTFLRCVRCGRDDEGDGLPPGPMVGGF